MSYGYRGRPLRPQPWPWRQAPRYGVPARPALPTVGQGEIVAYATGKGLPQPATVLEVAGGYVRIMVTWLPSDIQTIRTVGGDTLRPWGAEDDKAWENVAIRAQVAKAQAEGRR